MSSRIVKNILFASLALTFLACSVLTPKPTPSEADIEKEEQAIYSFFMPVSGTALILQSTSTGMSEENPQQAIDYVKSGLTGVSNETLKNFLERNKQPSQLSNDMQLGIDYVLLGEEELYKITSQPDWLEVLNQKYPNSNGYIMLSRVGFNKSLDQAVIYVGNMLAPLSGAGYYYLMEKDNGEWKMMQQVMVWIS